MTVIRWMFIEDGYWLLQSWALNIDLDIRTASSYRNTLLRRLTLNPRLYRHGVLTLMTT